MKERMRKTGEIVDVICYGGSPRERNSVLDYVNYIDSQGIEHTENHLNYYWDFEPIETTTDEHWQDVRERAAIAAMQGMLSNPELLEKVWDNREYRWKIEQRAIIYADALIEQLKKK